MVNKLLLPNEKELLFHLSRGSQQAFEKIYDFYSPKVYGKLLKQLKSEANANEVLQDIFLKIWVLRETIDPGKCFGSYVFTITANKVYDFYRKTASDKKLHQQLIKQNADAYSHVEETVFSRESAGILHKVIHSLPTQRRQVFILCKLDGKSYKEVSLSLGISTSTISDHIVKATHYIRKCFSYS